MKGLQAGQGVGFKGRIPPEDMSRLHDEGYARTFRYHGVQYGWFTRDVRGMFEIRDLDGRCVGLRGRYVTAYAYARSRLVYGLSARRAVSLEVMRRSKAKAYWTVLRPLEIELRIRRNDMQLRMLEDLITSWMIENEMHLAIPRRSWYGRSSHAPL